MPPGLKELLDILYQEDSTQGWLLLLLGLAQKQEGLRIGWEGQGDKIEAVRIFVRGTGVDARETRRIKNLLQHTEVRQDHDLHAAQDRIRKLEDERDRLRIALRVAKRALRERVAKRALREIAAAASGRRSALRRRGRLSGTADEHLRRDPDTLAGEPEMIICNVTHKGGTLWEIEHWAGIVARTKPARRIWVDVREIASVNVGPVDGDFWCHICLKSGVGHSFYAEHETSLATLIAAWRVHLESGKDRA